MNYGPLINHGGESSRRASETNPRMLGLVIETDWMLSAECPLPPKHSLTATVFDHD